MGFRGRRFLVRFMIRCLLYSTDLVRRNIPRVEIVGEFRRYRLFFGYGEFLIRIRKGPRPSSAASAACVVTIGVST